MSLKFNDLRVKFLVNIECLPYLRAELTITSAYIILLDKHLSMINCLTFLVVFIVLLIVNCSHMRL